jgi:hypothetical protein
MGSGSPVLTVDDVENMFDSLLRGARSGDFTDQPTGRHCCRGLDVLQPPVLYYPWPRGSEDEDTRSAVLDIPNAFAFLKK